MIAWLVAAALVTDPAPKAHTALKSQPVVERSLPARDQAAELNVVAVTLECTARASGRVENCRVLEETHPGVGFGEAAVALMRDARVPAGPADVQFARTIQFMP